MQTSWLICIVCWSLSGFLAVLSWIVSMRGSTIRTTSLKLRWCPVVSPVLCPRTFMSSWVRPLLKMFETLQEVVSSYLSCVDVQNLPGNRDGLEFFAPFWHCLGYSVSFSTKSQVETCILHIAAWGRPEWIRGSDFDCASPFKLFLIHFPPQHFVTFSWSNLIFYRREQTWDVKSPTFHVSWIN